MPVAGSVCVGSLRVSSACVSRPSAASHGIEPPGAPVCPGNHGRPLLLCRLFLGCRSVLSVLSVLLAAGLPLLQAHLSGLSSLHTLDVSTPSTCDTDADGLAAALGALCALRSLSLSGVSIGTAGWASIAQRLGALPLTLLNLGKCSLDSSFLLLHAPEAAVAAGMHAHAAEPPDSPSCPPTTRPACEFGAESATSGGSSMRMRDTLVELDVSNNAFNMLHAACYDQLQSLPALQGLAIGKVGCGGLCAARHLLPAIGEGAAFRLRALDVRGLVLGGHFGMLCAVLRVHTGLTALNLSCTGMPDGVAEVLQDLPQLRELRLGGNPAVWADGGDWRGTVRVLAALTALRLLSLEDCDLRKRHALALTQHLTGLTQLKVRPRCARLPCCMTVLSTMRKGPRSGGNAYGAKAGSQPPSIRCLCMVCMRCARLGVLRLPHPLPARHSARGVNMLCSVCCVPCAL